MNKENAAQYLLLIKALAEGKTLQIKPYGNWVDAPNELKLDASADYYRIKPERKTITGFVNVYSQDNYTVGLNQTKEQANNIAFANRIACVPVTITYEEGEGL